MDNNKNLANIGVNTSVGMESRTLMNLAASVFIAGFLILLTWYVFKRNLKVA